MQANSPDLGRRMPYVEPEGYARDLVARHAERAIAAGRGRRVVMRQRWRWTGVAASLLLLLSTGTLWLTQHCDSPANTFGMVNVRIAREVQPSPLDVFLEGISDEEACLIECCEIEEIEDFAP